MNWTVVIMAYAMWAGCMGWIVWTRRLALAISVLMVSGYVLLPVLPPSVLNSVSWKTVVISGVGLVGMAVGMLREAGRGRRRDWPEIKWWDAFMVAWVAAQMASEVANRQPPASMVIVGLLQVMQWAVPYIIGRVVLREMDDFMEMGRVVVWAGALLMPLALFENFFRPAFHQFMYGIPLVNYPATYPLILNKWGPKNFRPELFFEGGQLASSFFFAAAALVQGFLMAVGRGTLGGMGRGVLGKKMWDTMILVLLIATVVNSRAFLGMGMLVAGFAVLGLTRLIPTRAFLVLLAMILPVYVGLRVTHVLQTPPIAQDALNKNYSLWARMFQEDLVLKTLTDQDATLLGRGSQVDRIWQHTKIPELFYVDGEWVWLLIRTGWVGLAVGTLAVMAPLLMGIRAMPRRMTDAGKAAYVALTVIVEMELVNWIMNPHDSALWAMALGGIASVAMIKRPKETGGVAQRAPQDYVPQRVVVESIEVIDPRDGTVTRVKK